MENITYAKVVVDTHVANTPRLISGQQAKRIDADVVTIMRRTGTPSMTILIAEHGHMVYRRAYGIRDRERKQPATIESHYEIGSITKQFTAAAILQLQ